MGKLWTTVFIGLSLLLSNSGTTTAYEKEIRSLSESMAANIGEAGKKTIAVADFTDLQGNITELGRFLAEEFSVALAGSGKGFEVVDRTHLKVLLKEHKLSVTGLIDPQTARKLGKIAGVEALVTGSLTPFGDSIRLSVKILDTNTAKLIGGTAGNIPKTKAIEELLAIPLEPSTETPRTGTISPRPVRRPVAKKGAAVDVGRFLIEVESLKVLANNRVMAALAYINQTKQEFEITLDYPPYESAFASDDAGNEYTLEKSSGMARRYKDPNYDLIVPGPGYASRHSTFLFCSPGKRARTSFLFKRVSSGAETDVEKLGRFTISIAHYVRPTKNFDAKKPKGHFGFSATISNVQPD